MVYAQFAVSQRNLSPAWGECCTLWTDLVAVKDSGHLGRKWRLLLVVVLQTRFPWGCLSECELNRSGMDLPSALGRTELWRNNSFALVRCAQASSSRMFWTPCLALFSEGKKSCPYLKHDGGPFVLVQDDRVVRGNLAFCLKRQLARDLCFELGVNRHLLLRSFRSRVCVT